MIHLSASLIKDYIDCPKRAYYRMNCPENSQQNKYMAIGSAVHEAIEKSYNDEVAALNLAHDLVAKYNITEDTENVFKFTGNFFRIYGTDYFLPEDKRELYFKIPYKEDVLMTGRIDLIHNNSIYDWKTTKKPPKDLDDDIQFQLYYWAYNKLFKVPPEKIVYVSLPLKTEYIFHPIPEKIEKLENKVIPDVLSGIRQKNEERKGLQSKWMCNYCSFKTHCFREMEIGR